MYTKYSRIFSVGRYQSLVAVGLLVWGFTSYQWYFSYSTAIVGGSYDHKKWNEQKHEAPFFYDAATNRKTLPICNRSYDGEHFVKIFFKSVKKCGRNCVRKK